MGVLTEPINETTFDEGELATRTIGRRAFEAIVWGMPAVNFELLYQATVKAKGAWNQVIYWSRLPDIEKVL